MPSQEDQRLDALNSYNILDTLPEADYDDFTRLAAYICQTPTALITLVDTDRQWFKSRVGFPLQQTPRGDSFCAHNLVQPTPLMVVEDARRDERFTSNALVTGDPHVVFYAGVPLVDEAGLTLGSLCVLDQQPRQLSSEQGTALQMLGKQLINLLKLRRANEAILASEQQKLANLIAGEAYFRLLIEEAPLATSLFLGRELRVAVANEPMLAIWGKGPNQVGKTLAEILPEISNQPFLAILDDVYTSGQTYSAKTTRADLVIDGVLGSYYFDFTFKPLFDATGQVYGILQVVADVTEQVLADQAIARKDADLQNAVDLAELGTWYIDIRSERVNYSDRMAVWFGLLSGASIAELFTVIEPADAPAVQAAIDAVLVANIDDLMEVQHGVIHPITGLRRIIRSRGKVVRDASGNPIGIEGTSLDITFQVLMQQTLKEQVELRTRELRQANEDLTRSNDNLQQFAYVASHDLQEPLRKIQAFSNLLGDEYKTRFDERGLDFLKRIEAAGSRMSALIKDLLAYSHIATRQQDFGPVSLEGIVNDVLAALDWSVQQTQAIITVEALPVVNGDKSQLSQLMQNLLTNAIKFVRPNQPPRIRVLYARRSAEELPPQARVARQVPFYHQICVCDEGIGFDDKYQDRIFQVFQRLNNRQAYPGTGVGLAICQRVVENHGGGIWATSQLGEGATFCVYLLD